jgi:FdhE protein
MLKCPCCATTDHAQLLTLVPRGSDSRGAIEACTSCERYTKVVTVLQGCAPGSVFIEDLATVELDLAALEAGYRRPQGDSPVLALTLEVRPRRRVAWRHDD